MNAKEIHQREELLRTGLRLHILLAKGRRRILGHERKNGKDGG